MARPGPAASPFEACPAVTRVRPAEVLPGPIDAADPASDPTTPFTRSSSSHASSLSSMSHEGTSTRLRMRPEIAGSNGPAHRHDVVLPPRQRRRPILRLVALVVPAMLVAVACSPSGRVPPPVMTTGSAVRSPIPSGSETGPAGSSTIPQPSMDALNRAPAAGSRRRVSGSTWSRRPSPIPPGSRTRSSRSVS